MDADTLRAFGRPLLLRHQQDGALQGTVEPQLFRVDDDEAAALRAEVGAKRLRVGHVDELGRHHHREPAARPQHGQGRQDEWNPGIGVLREMAPKAGENLLGARLKIGRKILISDERRVAENGVKARTIRPQVRKSPAQEILRPHRP
jgi:hypothetical protein